MSKELEEKLKSINTEDLIWVVYLGIIMFSWYSNSLERKYFLYNDLKCKSKYRDTLIIIFSILLVIYTYFLKSSINDIKKLKCTDSYKKKKLVYTSFLASLLICISGFLLLYVAFNDDSIDVEIAFN
ncbi:MAG: hypothetical protein Q4E69_04285 [Bacilli bacterium]|nr:hypothetical protein [Bacilli bacterium]